jgi:DNA-binding transcriptional MerR regulator
MPVTLNDQIYYRTAEVCRLTGISRNTLFKLFKKGFFTEPEKRDWRGWRLFTESQIHEVKAKTSQTVEITYRHG